MNPQAIQAIRSAFASGEFGHAQRLWNAYAGQLRQAIVEGSATEAMLSETRHLVDWSRLVVIAFRGHAADRLLSARLAQLYSCPAAEGHPIASAIF
jgi:hypothetical protein